MSSTARYAHARRGSVAGLAIMLAAVVWPASACRRSASPPEQPEQGNHSTVAEPVPAPPVDATDARARPRSEERAAERRAMVEHQIARRGIDDPATLEAMRQVPRHWFVPRELSRFAYDDRPLPIGHDQTISQPYIVALMTQALALSSQARVLEVGTGSGYQAAVLAELTPHVFTIEIVEALGRRAAATFEQRGYATIRARIGDGYRGWPEHAPFDAIIVTCAPDHIPPALVEQLAPGGRICIPVGSEDGVQELVVVGKQADGALRPETLIPVRFVPMTGEARSRGEKQD